MMENHFTESGETTFFSSQPQFISENLFTELAKNHFSEKLFGRAPAGFTGELDMGALPNRALSTCSE